MIDARDAEVKSKASLHPTFTQCDRLATAPEGTSTGASRVAKPKTNGTQDEGLSSALLYAPRVYTLLLLRGGSTRLLVGATCCINCTVESFGYISRVWGRTHLKWEHPQHMVGRMVFSGIRVDMRDCPPEVHDTARCGTAWFVELVQLKPLKDKVPAGPMRVRSSVLGYAIGAACCGRTRINP